jgi:hypothetical protein
MKALETPWYAAMVDGLRAAGIDAWSLCEGDSGEPGGDYALRVARKDANAASYVAFNCVPASCRCTVIARPDLSL